MKLTILLTLIAAVANIEAARAPNYVKCGPPCREYCGNIGQSAFCTRQYGGRKCCCNSCTF